MGKYQRTPEFTKKPHSKDVFDKKKVEELTKCMTDPMHFLKNYLRIRHPTQQSLKFDPYPFQNRIVSAFHNNRFSICLASRQIGKSLSYDSIINKNNQNIKIGSLHKLSIKQRLINILENILIKLTKS